jgi:hypothetical protein
MAIMLINASDEGSKVHKKFGYHFVPDEGFCIVLS